MAAKLLNLIALSSLAILASSFGATPVNALSVDMSPNHAARHLGHHNLIAKKKRAESRRCKPRPSSSAVAASTTPAPSTSKPASTKAAAPATTTTKAASNNNNNNNSGNNNSGGGSSGGGGGKVGLAWPNGDANTLKNFKTAKVSAIYTWSPWKPAGSDALGLEFAPMLWGPKQISDFTRLVKPGYAHTVLGFNEPDHNGQANLDPGYAASLWKQYIQPLKNQGYSLISPAVTSAPAGKTWMRNFFNACTGCTFDAVAVHWYGTKADEFIAYVTDYHNTFGRDIWVTEFACQNFAGGAQCNAGQVVEFMNTVTGWMDNTSWVKKYFAFGVMHDMVGVNTLNQLMAPNGQPTELGWNYLT
ncbi:unnamed protein product [Cyclocybe aegerita]|uniref:Asl1-like glycosyl hydrolase catalytic domain-containing protein n=1 Tax=Cyclocybe aegerita TaxID=1973307 RepID=A0A8S0XE40_CYCAE|nr:unnamed protein product [Cyclocybe aegerita]